MADIKRTVAIVFSSEDKASQSVREIDRKLQSLGDSSGTAATQAKRLDDELSRVGGNEVGIDRAATALKALAASLIVKDFIDANVAQEQFIRTLTLVTGSAEGARREFDFVREASNRLGVEVRGTADAYAKFAAATKGTALEGEGARVIFEGFAGSLAQVGVSSAEISGAFVQLSQGISKGKFELEDLKSIAERFPAFFPKFAESLGITTERLFDLVSAGKITGQEILIFGQQLREGLGGADFNGFNNNLARLQNGINDAFLIIGQTGAFEALTTALQGGTVAVVGAISVFELLGSVVEGVLLKFRGGSNFDFGQFIADAFNKAADRSRVAVENFTGADRATKAIGDTAVGTGEKLESAFNRGALSADALKKASAEIDKNLKALGIDPKTFEKPVDVIQDAFSALARNAASTGEQILVGLTGALRNLPPGQSFSPIAREIDEAFKSGKLSATEYEQALALLRLAISNSAPSFRVAADETKKQGKALEDTTKQAREAEKAARDYALELEKLASNERIKVIEARVTLEVARAESDAKRVVAAFEGISTTITSTGDLLGNLFGDLDKFDSLSTRAQSLFRQQAEAENRRRDEALRLQRNLTEAEIGRIRAQTQALERGDALIRVDGSGLQPHLEAFMFEILRAIQTRVNQDGLALLLNA